MEFTDFEMAWFRRPIDVPPASAAGSADPAPARLARGSLPPGRLGLLWTGWALCPWTDGADAQLVHPEDVDRLRALSPYGKVFEVGLTIDDYTELRYAGALFRVRPSLLRQIPGPRFAIGERVRIPEGADACVCAIGWHHREHRLFYVVRRDDQPARRRYWEDELEIPAASP